MGTYEYLTRKPQSVAGASGKLAKRTTQTGRPIASGPAERGSAPTPRAPQIQTKAEHAWAGDRRATAALADELLPLGPRALQRACATCGASGKGGHDEEKRDESGPTGVSSGRNCTACEKEEQLQRAAAARAPGGVPRDVSLALRQPGHALDGAVKDYFEPRLGASLDGVRVHTGAAADRSARAVGALAYTVGKDIVFRNGLWDPDSEPGRRLLGHELVHTVQQRAPGFQQRRPISDPSSAAEREAETAGERMARGERVEIPSAPAAAAISRDQDPTAARKAQLIQVLQALSALGQQSTRGDPRFVVGKIMETIGSISLADQGNFVPISQVVSRSFSSQVFVRFLEAVDALPPAQRPQRTQALNLRPFQVSPDPYTGGPRGLLFPATVAAASPFAALAEAAGRSSAAFGAGLIDGMKQKLPREVVQAFANRLTASSVLNVVAPVIFSAGATVGVGKQIKDLLSTVIDIVGSPVEFVTSIGRLIETFMSDADAAYDIGFDAGSRFGEQIKSMAGENLISFTFHLGELVGPTLVQIILMFVGIGEISEAVGLTRVTRRLASLARESRFGQRLAELRGKVRLRPRAPKVPEHVPGGHVPEPRGRAPGAHAPEPHEPGAPRPREPAESTPRRVPRGLADLCSLGSLLCRLIPESVLKDPEVGPYPNPDRVPRPGGPYKVRGTSDSEYRNLRKVLGKDLRSIYLADPNIWTEEFRVAWRAANKHLGEQAIRDILEGKRAARGSSWPFKDGKPWEVHHRRPLDFGGDNSPGNLVALENSVHVPYTSWWKRVKFKIRRIFLEDGTAAQWDRIIGGGEDTTLPSDTP